MRKTARALLGSDSPLRITTKRCVIWSPICEAKKAAHAHPSRRWCAGGVGTRQRRNEQRLTAAQNGVSYGMALFFGRQGRSHVRVRLPDRFHSPARRASPASVERCGRRGLYADTEEEATPGWHCMPIPTSSRMWSATPSNAGPRLVCDCWSATRPTRSSSCPWSSRGSRVRCPMSCRTRA